MASSETPPAFIWLEASWALSILVNHRAIHSLLYQHVQESLGPPCDNQVLFNITGAFQHNWCSLSGYHGEPENTTVAQWIREL